MQNTFKLTLFIGKKKTNKSPDMNGKMRIPNDENDYGDILLWKRSTSKGGKYLSGIIKNMVDMIDEKIKIYIESEIVNPDGDKPNIVATAEYRDHKYSVALWMSKSKNGVDYYSGTMKDPKSNKDIPQQSLI
jgi:uncharacterized protein (DUF736 family)